MTTFQTIAEAASAVEAGRLAPTALLDTCLARAERLDGVLNVHITRLEEAARVAARTAEAEIGAGHYRGPLHGIPVGLKDIYSTAGVHTTSSSRVHQDRVPEFDAVLVARLKQAGAIITGKLATYEFAFGGPSTDIPFPLPKNPWDMTRVTGGSSSGSAVAVATGMCLGAMGSDTAGSIRGPAGYCGLAGLKPTYGRLPLRGVMPLAYSLDTAGPMGWTAEDCALMFLALVDSADDEVTRWHKARKAGAAGKRVGVIRHFFEEDANAARESRGAVLAATSILKAAGAEVIDVRLSPLQDYHACCLVILLSEAFEVHRRDLAERPELYGESARERLVAGAFISAAEYVRANRVRGRLQHEMLEALVGCDALLVPTNLSAAPPLSSARKLAILEGPYLTSPFNVAGVPTLSVNAGFLDKHLPVGVSLAGRPNGEAELLALGEIVERAIGQREKRPPTALVE
jgi:aspartyl-tRNA(Asn)/glutamyl-tRNA(Gln) amidotransferase subunit A